MIDWKVEDLSPGKKKGILRHILEQGSGLDYPNDGALVTGIYLIILTHNYTILAKPFLSLLPRVHSMYYSSILLISEFTPFLLISSFAQSIHILAFLCLISYPHYFLDISNLLSLLVELEGRLQADGKVFDTRTLSFPLGEGTENNICEGIERALERFQKGEKSRLTIAPKYGYKSEGNASLRVPPDSTLEYIVKLVNFEKAKESWAMDGAEKLEQAKIFKEKGTGYFKNSKFQLTIKMYKRVTSLLEGKICIIDN